jgi:hypothetical protein
MKFIGSGNIELSFMMISPSNEGLENLALLSKTGFVIFLNNYPC